jgi:hypothetical protein
VPARVIARAFSLRSCIDKWRGDEATAAAVPGMGRALPFLAKVGPGKFLKLLAAGEIALMDQACGGRNDSSPGAFSRGRAHRGTAG